MSADQRIQRVTIFWNVDTQYDFMRNDESHKGKLPVPNARLIEPNLEYLTALASQKGIRVVNTGDWHTKESKEISTAPDFINTFPEHCMAYTKGAQFVPATAPTDSYLINWVGCHCVEERSPILVSRNITLYKDHFDVFQGNQYTEDVLRVLRPDRAIVYGVATNVCVDFAVMGLRKRGIEVYVPTDAIKELPNLPLEATLKKWQDAGAVLIKTREVEKYL